MWQDVMRCDAMWWDRITEMCWVLLRYKEMSGDVMGGDELWWDVMRCEDMWWVFFLCLYDEMWSYLANDMLFNEEWEEQWIYSLKFFL